MIEQKRHNIADLCLERGRSGVVRRRGVRVRRLDSLRRDAPSGVEPSNAIPDVFFGRGATDALALIAATGACTRTALAAARNRSVSSVGRMIKRFGRAGIVILNHAEPGDPVTISLDPFNPVFPEMLVFLHELARNRGVTPRTVLPRRSSSTSLLKLRQFAKRANRLFGGVVRTQVLLLLVSSPNGANASDIARVLGARPGVVRIAFDELETMGIIVSRFVGRDRVACLNEAFEAAPEFRDLLLALVDRVYPHMRGLAKVLRT